MATLDFKKVAVKLKRVVYSAHPMPPLLSLHSFSYPGGIEFDYHDNPFSSACLIVSGAMKFQERGREPFLCEAGTLAMLPEGSLYRWRIDEPTETLHCIHKGFSSHEHDELALLFGVWRKRPSSVKVGVARAEAFQREMDELKERKAPKIQFSIATLKLLADAVEGLGKDDVRDESEESAPLVKCVYFIERNLTRPLSVEELAQHANVGASRLFQLFQERFGTPPLQYVAKRKVEEAARLLSSTTLSNGEIAEKLGFASVNYFIRFFRKHSGSTPMEFRTREKARLFGDV